MAPRATAYTGETGKLYRVSWAYSQMMVYLLAPMLAALALFLILVVLRRGSSISGAALVASVVASGIGFLMWRHARRQADTTFLVLSSGGIAYYGADVVIKTTWANTKEITSDAMPCLMLYQPAATSMGLSASRDPLAERRIPLYPFAYSKRSELARDLRRYAPHLFA